MRTKSHMLLGRYLAENYLSQLSRGRTLAFLLGCIQPDGNPITYLKGSLRFQLLRGHNRYNTLRYRKRLSARLERKRHLSLLDYYSLGKLIHYTADAFTYAHNADFPLSLELHRKYEARLQEYFLQYLREASIPEALPRRSLHRIILFWDREYGNIHGNVHTDCFFTFTVCCHILAALSAYRVPLNTQFSGLGQNIRPG